MSRRRLVGWSLKQGDTWVVHLSSVDVVLATDKTRAIIWRKRRDALAALRWRNCGTFRIIKRTRRRVAKVQT